LTKILKRTLFSVLLLLVSLGATSKCEHYLLKRSSLKELESVETYIDRIIKNPHDRNGANAYPDIFKKLQTYDYQTALSHFIHKEDESLPEMTERILKYNADVILNLNLISKELELIDEPLAKNLGLAVKRLTQRLSFREKTILKQKKLIELSKNNLKTSSKAYKNLWKIIDTIVSNHHGIFGELFLCFKVPHFYHSSFLVRSFLQLSDSELKLYTKLDPSEFRSRFRNLPQNYQNLEVDVVIKNNQKFYWLETKSFYIPYLLKLENEKRPNHLMKLLKKTTDQSLKKQHLVDTLELNVERFLYIFPLFDLPEERLSKLKHSGLSGVNTPLPF